MIALQWTTDENLFVTKSGTRIVVSEGMERIINRINELQRIFVTNPTLSESRFLPQCHLSRERFNVAINPNKKGVGLLREAKKLLSKSEKEIKLELGHEYGEITVDPKNGHITLQVIPVNQGKRTMTLTNFKENPGKEAISSRMSFKYHDAEKRPIAKMRFGKKALYKTLQNFLVATASKPENIKTLRETPKPDIEPGLLKFLSEEPLERAGFVNQKMINSLIDQIVTNSISKLKADGKDVQPKELVLIPGFQTGVIDTLSEKLLPLVSPQKQEEFLSDALGTKLITNNPSDTEARALIEEFVVRAYFKTRLRRKVDQYAKELNQSE